MRNDPFSRCHPAVNFLYFVGAIAFGVVIQHPAYMIAGCVGAAAYYLLLNGRKGRKTILGMLPLLVVLSAINPLFNTYGATVLFYLFGRPYTLEALYYGMAIAAIFVIMMLWFGCYNAVLTEPKLLLLDEPTKGLDSFFKVKFASILEKLKQGGITVVMVSHDVEFCAEHADLVSMFFDGQILSTDTPHRFFGQNSFYTTAANRMSRCVFRNAVTAGDVVTLYKQNTEDQV